MTFATFTDIRVANIANLLMKGQSAYLHGRFGKNAAREKVDLLADPKYIELPHGVEI